MRNNGPVTQQEFQLPAGRTLVSVTDLKGRIVFCNRAFVTVSGFSHAELMGQPHNLVRHPDMPEEAFPRHVGHAAGGRPWTAVVKNRRKNGDHYWVRANATPVKAGDRVVGYLSVRTPSAKTRWRRPRPLVRPHARRGRSRAAARLHRSQVVRVDLRGRMVSAGLTLGGPASWAWAASLGLALVQATRRLAPLLPAVAWVPAAGAAVCGRALADCAPLTSNRCARRSTTSSTLPAGDLTHAACTGQ
jgi:aerotaxis receptor